MSILVFAEILRLKNFDAATDANAFEFYMHSAIVMFIEIPDEQTKIILAVRLIHFKLQNVPFFNQLWSSIGLFFSKFFSQVWNLSHNNSQSMTNIPCAWNQYFNSKLNVKPMIYIGNIVFT